jgi:hypothetical protein
MPTSFITRSACLPLPLSDPVYSSFAFTHNSIILRLFFTIAACFIYTVSAVYRTVSINQPLYRGFILRCSSSRSVFAAEPAYSRPALFYVFFILSHAAYITFFLLAFLFNAVKNDSI